MRISDWSSDVCASDLEKQKASEKRWQEENRELHLKSKIKQQAKRRAQAVSSGGEFTAEDIDAMLAAQKKKCWYCGTKLTAYHVDHRIPLARGGSNGPENLVIACPACNLSKGRSEEHTSELQSLMRISYAVFCLKKKKRKI